MSSEVVIRVEGLGKCYHVYQRPQDRLFQMFLGRRKTLFKEFWAVRDVSFEIGRGEAVGIVGRNGSGKSTLLQMICGTLPPTTGFVSVSGRVAALLELGSGFNPEFTGRENVYLNGAILGLSEAEIRERFDEIELFAGIGDFIDQPVKTYSSGMLVRLAFAVQVCVEPDVLVVDEALAVGDALFQKRCFERMERLRVNGTTLLFVSHDQESIRTLTDRAIFLHNGGVRYVGSSAQTLLEYRRLLHEEETKELSRAADWLRERSEQSVGVNAGVQAASAQAPGDASSFGDLDAEVTGVAILDASGNACTHFDPRDNVIVQVSCVANQPLSNLNVSLRIRNKEGVKIYSWGTLNQDIAMLAEDGGAATFWEKSFSAGEQIVVEFEFVCGLGSNLYEVQAAITHEGKPYYAEQRILHWRDEAAFFTVVADQRTYFFGGTTDLKMVCREVQG